MSSLSHKQVLQQASKLIPALTADKHKGDAGRIGIVGGSADYSGAPFYASMAALRLGADMAHVICQPSAGNVIKTYSPDLIVHTDLKEDSTEKDLNELFDSLMPRLHTLVVGPGLGRSPSMQLAAKVAIAQARKRGTYLVIDADGLFLVQNEPDTVRGYDRVVLTPNVVEFARLCKAVNLSPDDDGDKETLAKRLSQALEGPTVLQKGAADIISNGEVSLKNEVEGGLRRCGGQGDLLSGSTGVFLAWGAKWQEEQDSKDKQEDKETLSPGLSIPLLAAYAAGTVTRETSRRTFERLKRQMQASDMLGEVGAAFAAVFPDEGEVEEGDGKGAKL